jgi:ubiquinone/menaquinone biosynthesis C-methylase UbiE
VCSTDASPTVVQRMRELAASRGCTAVAWQVADMLALPFADGSFDIVIEKGSIDCFMARPRAYTAQGPALTQCCAG